MTATRLVEATATLRAGDVTALAEWYRDKLGFSITMSWGEPAEYARVQRDAVELGIGLLGERFGPASVYAIVTGVDALYAEFAGRGVRVGREIGDQPYRMRDFDLLDPERNRICFGEALERVTGAAAVNSGG
jgi:catechol 2,3-dioxygenase-like lactoylglutathione lyase family enzyme